MVGGWARGGGGGGLGRGAEGVFAARRAGVFCSCVAQDFQHILRVLNTNVDGKDKIMYALTRIKGIGRRFSNNFTYCSICCISVYLQGA